MKARGLYQEGPHWILGLADWLTWLASEPQKFSCLCLPSSWSNPNFLPGFSWCSWSHSKHLTELVAPSSWKRLLWRTNQDRSCIPPINSDAVCLIMWSGFTKHLRTRRESVLKNSTVRLLGGRTGVPWGVCATEQTGLYVFGLALSRFCVRPTPALGLLLSFLFT